jgi:hypothetical protein
MSTYTTGSHPSSITINSAGSGYTTTGSTVTLNTGAGVAGSYLVGNGTLTGTSYSTAWTQPSQNFVSNGGTRLMSIPAEGNEVILEKAATLDVQGSVKINGIDLEERLNVIEKVLQIPTRDVTMENKHPKLKELYEQYVHELEKYKTWERIKGDENGTT